MPFLGIAIVALKDLSLRMKKLHASESSRIEARFNDDVLYGHSGTRVAQHGEMLSHRRKMHDPLQRLEMAPPQLSNDRVAFKH